MRSPAVPLEDRGTSSGDDEALALWRQMAGDLAAIRALLERQQTLAPDDERHTRLLRALADVLGDLDLSFDTDEVLAHARVDYELAERSAHAMSGLPVR